MTGILIKRNRDIDARRPCGDGGRDWDDETEDARNIAGCWTTSEARKRQERILPRVLERGWSC